MILKKLVFWLLEKFRKNKGYEQWFYGRIVSLNKSPKDKRDFILSTIKNIPTTKRLKGVATDNQSLFKSCTGFGIPTSIEILLFEKHGQRVKLSARHNWYHSRKLFGCFPKDSGVYNRTALQVAHKIGVSPEVLCPYSSSMKVMNLKPSLFADSFCRMFRIKSYYICKDNAAIKNALAQGFPVVIGMMVWKEFAQLNKLVVEPKKSNSSYIGGHSMCLFGYNKQGFDVVNSWGSFWGQNGLAIIPYDIASNKRCLFEAWAVTDIERK